MKLALMDRSHVTSYFCCIVKLCFYLAQFHGYRNIITISRSWPQCPGAFEQSQLAYRVTHIRYPRTVRLMTGLPNLQVLEFGSEDNRSGIRK